jgi:hypothetical protein
MINPPIISDGPPYQKPKNGEGRRQPPPEVGFVGSSGAVAARLIIAVRISLTGVRHESVLFSVDQCRTLRNLLTARNVPANETPCGPVTIARQTPSLG